MKTTLKEFFHIHEGPLDPAFKPAPEVPMEDGLEGLEGAAPADPAMGAVPPTAPPGMMTQDVAPMEAPEMNFFGNNVQSAVTKFDMETQGFDASSVQAFADGMDQFVSQLYTDKAMKMQPQDRQAFEVEYQKIAADWSKDLTKTFEKLLKLAGSAGQF